MDNDITIVTTCMNRSQFLEQTLPTWAIQPIKEIIILDWSSEESIKPLIDKNQNGKILLARVDDKEFFSKTKAQNLVHRLTQLNKPQYILSIDSDILLKNDFIDSHPIDNKIFYRGDQKKDISIMGTNLIPYNTFFDIGGYNELLDGWGDEDWDFYIRVNETGINQLFFNDGLQHINHDDYLRTSNYKIKNKKFSQIKNKKTFNAQKWTRLNKMELQYVTLYYPNNRIENINI